MEKERKPLQSFRDLDIYKRAYDISLRIYPVSLSLPKHEHYGLADQMRRASRSVCSNIAEGFAKRILSSAEFKRFLMMAFGSCEEMKVWLDYCKDLQFLQKDIADSFAQEYVEISKMIFSLHRSWNN